MDKFSALSDPTRRKIIETLAQHGPLSAREIYDQFTASAPAISQHLKILRETRLVQMEKRAQLHIYSLNPEAILEVDQWARQITRLWSQRFDTLDQILKVETIKMMDKPSERNLFMETQTIKEVTLMRVFDAPRELVFKAWTDPRLMAQWFGPHMFSIPVCELDVRPGGAMRIVMHGPDDLDYPMHGVFREIIPPERIVFSTRAIDDENGAAQLETLNTVTLTDLGAQTRLTLHIEVVKATPAAAGPLSGMEMGWSQSLEKLGDALAKPRPASR
ncbi:MAG: metalloregulator ArsR/SmtB family transcription factor [Chloroflexi bacterium]|nr:metalloregulator ArsR/SmtB family transcription factor [Chloroflexota bacterium]